jgi:hypothetical protein
MAISTACADTYRVAVSFITSVSIGLQCLSSPLLFRVNPADGVADHFAHALDFGFRFAAAEVLIIKRVKAS